MWDRLKIGPHSSGRELGHPLDDDRIRVGLGIGYGGVSVSAAKGYSYSIKGGPAPARPPREFFESRYETAPAVKEPPLRNPNRIKVRTSNFRAPSSVYSDDSPPLAQKYTATVATKYGYRHGGADEISPPSSPEPDAARGADRFLPGDVSPIDEDDAPAYSHHAGIPTTDALRNGRSDRAFVPESRQGTQAPSQYRGTTNIPSMRRERRRQSDAATRDPNPAQRGPAQQQSRNPPPLEAPRWDPLTGEQTSSTRGRPSQGNTSGAEQWQPQNLSIATSVQNGGSAAAPPSFGDRVRRIAKKAAAAREGNTDPAAGAFTSSRPGWRGASGRSAIVDPVHDTREVPPLKIPEKSARRNIPGFGSKPGTTPEGPTRRGQTPPISPPASETPIRSGPREAIGRVLPSSQPLAATQTQPQTAHRYPSPPLSGNPVAADAPAVVAARELVRDGQYGFPAHPSPTFVAHSPESGNVVRRKPPPVHTNYQHQHHQHQVSVSSVYSQQTDVPQPSPQHIHDTAAPPAASPEEPYVQPPSRFSISTYATSNTRTTRDDLDDPVDDDQPPVPTLPANYQQQQQPQPASARPPSDNHSPVTSPIDQFMTSPFSSPPSAPPPIMNHPALARTQAQALALDRPSSRASTSDMNKTLPPAPPEQSAGEAHDRVGLLNAQLRALANRRININRSIQQMTELMPTDKLMNSAEVVRKRESEKKKVEGLRDELADVQREEYELGLKLHRAYKRLDREAEWEPTTLWVRRVTG
ncbi:hypothetical protein NEMBOFW57_007204 [Staphylotrichum longicolle]|uniref:Uncharacterized protein n=1 Tax=Staphylotrichum longicolle TaxID=669026 RepID=A0AAD4EUL9_9PEZI|nr:hypothetical protein NEMBOFW57_007204 [Staphylotrichum longicolle]